MYAACAVRHVVYTRADRHTHCATWCADVGRLSVGAIGAIPGDVC